MESKTDSHNSLENVVQRERETHVNPLTPNDSHRGRTAPLTSEVAFYIFIQQI